jgi:ribosomal protein L3
MAKGILGIKVGMTQIFDADGNLVPEQYYNVILML